MKPATWLITLQVTFLHGCFKLYKWYQIVQSTTFNHFFEESHFTSLVSFYTSLKHEKASSFLMFVVGVETDWWHEVSLSTCNERVLGDFITYFKPFQPSVAFHIESSHFISTSNKLAGFYMKCNSRQKWVKLL